MHDLMLLATLGLLMVSTAKAAVFDWRTQVVCNGEDISMFCQNSTKLVVLDAVYRLFDANAGRCRHVVSGVNSSCNQGHMGDWLKNKCTGKTSCIIPTKILTDEAGFCPPVVQLMVNFTCVPHDRFVTMTPIVANATGNTLAEPMSFAMQLFWEMFRMMLVFKYLKAHGKEVTICLALSVCVGVVCFILLLVIVEYTGRNIRYWRRPNQARQPKKAARTASVKIISAPLLVDHNHIDNEVPASASLLHSSNTTSQRASSAPLYHDIEIEVDVTDSAASHRTVPQRRMSEQEVHELDDLIDTMRHFCSTLERDRGGASQINTLPAARPEMRRSSRPQSCSPSLHSFHSHNSNNNNNTSHDHTARYIQIECNNVDRAVTPSGSIDARVYPVPLPHKSSQRALSIGSHSNKNMNNVGVPLHIPTRSTSDSGTAYDVT